MKKENLKIAFIGTGPLAESAFVELINLGIKPKLLITKPDSKSGRDLELKAPLIKKIAESFNIKVIQPEKLRLEIEKEESILNKETFDIFLVASYGKIMPREFLDIPLLGTLNIHPSYLPFYRGATPIETALLHGDKKLGISLMVLDEEVDHGPIIIQKEFDYFETLPNHTSADFEELGGKLGAQMFVEIIEDFIDGAITVQEQDHSLATVTSKLNKESGFVDLEKDSLEKIHNIYRACTPWPSCFFILKHKDKEIKVKITEMLKEDGVVKITKVLPESKKEMSFESFQNGYKK